MKYPLSHNAGKGLSEYFYDILTFHVPPGPDVRILDPTCGKRYLWEKFMKRSLRTGKQLIEDYGEVVFSDIRELNQDVQADFRDLPEVFKARDIDPKFDGVVLDLPYLFGYKGSDDEREDDYGGYDQTFKELRDKMYFANHMFPSLLKPNGKLILKCSDQYQTEERAFYPLHHFWGEIFNLPLGNFRWIDFFIYIHHRMSPTAFQVKDRPCSVIMHTYFMVFEVN